ncbi:serine/threonine-protein kinase [Mesoterricola silvestris]|uniref:Protein kinase domain-containing protein n=1 Tax=Mesoterricola silvestris TaxID=2927979 RepID=A0AA48K9Z6_9BACT|nr:serine/threonine-protein kinase [Mesoterricola silvestris]BDU72817.1 hypothetical protein METEAL_19910 [Mesoterricola silvestris]
MPPPALNLQPMWLDAQCPRLGRYVLGPLLGKGGMGEVMEGWDLVLHRVVALKVLRNMEPTAVIRFMHEAQVHARVAHPNICRVYDVEVSDGTVMISMQLVRGLNLEQARGELATEEAVTLLAQVAEGVHAAHRLKLIHRDLKPSNILLERGDDGRWVPYICDFGLALALDEPAFTAGNGIIGTPAYMAPEQFRGDRSRIGPATDVYCLGGTLHYLLYGRPPGGSVATSGGPVPKKRAIELPQNREVPRDLRSILVKCLQPDAGLRYGTAAGLAEDLWAFRNGEKVDASLPGPLGRLWRRWRSRAAAVLPYALGAGGLLCGSAATALGLGLAQSRAATLAHRFQVETRQMELDLRLERAQPPHDLRPALARVRSRMDALRAEMKALGPAASGPGHLALAQACLVLRDFGRARAEAEQAWEAGDRGPASARVLACALGTEAALGEGGGPPPEPGRLEALFHRGRGLASEGETYGQALMARVRRDDLKAAAEGLAEAKANPWRVEASALACASLGTLGQAAMEGGDFPGAQARFDEALDVARRALALAPSDGLAHHATLVSARNLAALQLDQGRLGLGTLAPWEAQCRQALERDPGDPRLQDDWLGLRILKVLRLRDLGQDGRRDLDEAMIFQGTRLKEPLTRALATDRMAVLWLQAQAAFQRGEEPGPALGEALRSPDPAPLLFLDLRREALILKARAEAARNLDPRPSLDEALARVPLTDHPAWTASQSACEAWLVRAAWEAAHGQDAAASLRRARTHLNAALQLNPGSVRGRALEARLRGRP